MFFRNRSNPKQNVFRALPRLEILEVRLVPAGEFSCTVCLGQAKLFIWILMGIRLLEQGGTQQMVPQL